METIAPSINALNRPFWDGARADVLRLPHCVDRATAFWPPSPMSPFTGGAVDWRDASPDGVAESLVIYRRAFQRTFAPLLPYGITLVALDAGPRLLAHVEAPDAAAAPRAGSRVAIRFRILIDGGHPLPIAVRID